MSRSDEMDTLYDCNDMAATRLDPWDYPPIKHRGDTMKTCDTLVHEIDLPIELLPDIEDHIAETLAASIRHVKGLNGKKAALCADLSREFKPLAQAERVGAFVTDIRRGLREWLTYDPYVESVAPSIYNKLLARLASVNIWDDVGELKRSLYSGGYPTAGIKQIMEWLERAKFMAEPNTVEDLAERLDKLKKSIPLLDRYTQAVKTANASGNALLGQMESVLDGAEVPHTTRLSDCSFVRTNLPK